MNADGFALFSSERKWFDNKVVFQVAALFTERILSSLKIKKKVTEERINHKMNEMSVTGRFYPQEM